MALWCMARLVCSRSRRSGGLLWGSGLSPRFFQRWVTDTAGYSPSTVLFPVFKQCRYLVRVHHSTYTYYEINRS
jgi:hypothetical protein